MGSEGEGLSGVAWRHQGNKGITEGGTATPKGMSQSIAYFTCKASCL